MSELKNILNQGPQPTEDALKRYLKGTSSEEERFTIENQMADEAFMNDAIEGLQEFKDQNHVQDYVNKINKELNKHTFKKKRRKLNNLIEDKNWTLVTVVLIIILCILGYFVINLTMQQKFHGTIEQQKK